MNNFEGAFSNLTHVSQLEMGEFQVGIRTGKIMIIGLFRPMSQLHLVKYSDQDALSIYG